jgi:uncharacterized membrane-anchored protein YhcB (DUF1043 family)
MKKVISFPCIVCINTKSLSHNLLFGAVISPKQTRLEDARLSIQDCSTEMDDVDEELMQASEAVEEAFAAYMDLLDDLRSANAEQRQHYGEMSLTSAMSLKVLRQELDKILPKNKE